MYCALEFGFHEGRRRITSVCSSGVYNNISTATGWRGGRHRDPSDEHRRVILEIHSKELYNTLELDRTARHRIVKEILKAVVSQNQVNCSDIPTIAESVAPAQMLTLKRAMDTTLPLGGNNRLSEASLTKYAAQLLLNTHHSAGKAITSTYRWPRSWTTTAARSSGNRMGRASRHTQVTLLKWQQQYRRWPDPDALLAKWEKYYSRYHTSHGEPWGSEPA